jgi:hypothetical protein
VASTTSSLRSRGAPEGVTTAASGSENWETYDEDEDEATARDGGGGGGRGQREADAAEAYYARLRAQHHGSKRASPDGGGGGNWEKRARGNGPLAAREEWVDEEGRY